MTNYNNYNSLAEISKRIEFIEKSFEICCRHHGPVFIGLRLVEYGEVRRDQILVCVEIIR
jgi:hypothetical protein